MNCLSRAVRGACLSVLVSGCAGEATFPVPRSGPADGVEHGHEDTSVDTSIDETAGEDVVADGHGEADAGDGDAPSEGTEDGPSHDVEAGREDVEGLEEDASDAADAAMDAGADGMGGDADAAVDALPADLRDDGDGETTTVDVVTDGDAAAGDAVPDAGAACPEGMAEVAGSFCIDRFEGALEEWDGSAWAPGSPYETVSSRRVRAVPAEGIPPQGYISGAEAAAACAESGKRLCTATEWEAACRGPSETTWPYGGTYSATACNDTYEGGHPMIDYFGTSAGIWDMEHMNDPGINQQPNTIAPGGEFAECVSAWGVYDMHGNLHEWISDPAGTFRGGFYADAEINGAGCTYRTTAHEFTYHDYSTGFRCCADLR